MHALLLQKKLQEYLGSEISVSQTIAFDYPTLEELVVFVEQAQNTRSIPQSVPLIKDNHEDSDIAIIGIGCRLPGKVHNLQDLWRLLSQGVDAIEPLPKMEMGYRALRRRSARSHCSSRYFR